jgi:hypothetical protein
MLNYNFLPEGTPKDALRNKLESTMYRLCCDGSGILWACPLCATNQGILRTNKGFAYGPVRYSSPPDGAWVGVYTPPSKITDPKARRSLRTFKTFLFRHAKAEHGLRDVSELPFEFRPQRIRPTKEERASVTPEEAMEARRSRRARVSRSNEEDEGRC